MTAIAFFQLGLDDVVLPPPFRPLGSYMALVSPD